MSSYRQTPRTVDALDGRSSPDPPHDARDDPPEDAAMPEDDHPAADDDRDRHLRRLRRATDGQGHEGTHLW